MCAERDTSVCGRHLSGLQAQMMQATESLQDAYCANCGHRDGRCSDSILTTVQCMHVQHSCCAHNQWNQKHVDA
jgi:hypothetical protein